MFLYCLLLLLVIYAAALLIRLFMKISIKRCNSPVSMEGKVIIVTGGNAGIGFHTAKDLAARGGRVILACRNEKRGSEARDRIIAETGNKDVVFKHLNLSSLKSVRTFAEDFKKQEAKLDVLVNNAGVSASNDRLTEDNIVEGMQINYFSPFLLTILLLPLLKKSGGRIVNLNSVCHFRGEINYAKLNRVNAYTETLTYANSKLCGLVFTKELARRTVDTKVTVTAVHPGVILTNIVTQENFFRWLSFVAWCWLCCRTAEEGAQTPIYLCVADEVKATSGQYFVDCAERFVLWTATNKKVGKDLWEYSERMVGLTRDENSVFS